MKIFLTSVFVLMLVPISYGQFYDPETIWHRCGTEYYEHFGSKIAGVGDQNGDGIDDFMIVAPPINGQPQTSYTYLYYGGNPPDTIPDIVFNENNYQEALFRDIENIGDVNGDGGIDIAISHESYVSRDVYIFFGGNILDTIPDIILNESIPSSDVYGSNIEGLGDVNGDGYDDVAVFASNYPVPFIRGKVWIYFGGSPMDTIADWEREGVGQNAIFGRSIAGKGDLNGDGYDDFAIYEWTGYPELSQTTYYIFLGGLELDTIPDVIIDGENYYPQIDIASSSALIPNLNGDPYADLVITAGRTTNVVVFHGGDPMDTEIDLVLNGFQGMPPNYGMEVSATGDVNEDGFDDIIVAQTGSNDYGGRVLVYFGNPWMDGQPDIRRICSPGHGCGRTLVACGDVNGDGVDDMIFGSWDEIINNEGCVDIWAGDSTWVVNVPEEMPQAAPKLFQLREPYPNPFNNTVTIPFEIFPGINGDVSLIVYNVLGQLVADLRPAVKGAMSGQRTGYYEVIWDGKNPSGIDVGSGVYIVVLHISVHRQLQKITLLR